MHPVLKTSETDQRCNPTANSQPEKKSFSFREESYYPRRNIYFFSSVTLLSPLSLQVKCWDHWALSQTNTAFKYPAFNLIWCEVSKKKMPGFRSEKYLRPQSCSDSIGKKTVRNHCKIETNTKRFPFSLLLSFLPLLWMIILSVKLLINKTNR